MIRRAARFPLLALLCLALVQAGLPPEASAAVRYYKSFAGREVLVVVPDEHQGRGPLPLVLALHGCRQDPESFLDGTGLESLADPGGYVLALPPAPSGATNPLGCWPWWEPEEQRRDGSEARFLVGIVRGMDLAIDEQRVHALGFSAGGAMAAILGVVYPDVFAAAGIHSGLGFAAAAGTACALDTMEDGPGRAGERGTLAYLHQSSHRLVPTLVIHGSDDEVVDPSHAAGLVEETAQRYDWVDNDRDDDSFDDRPEAVVENPGPCRDDDCHPHRLRRFAGEDGRIVLESLTVDGLGHDWSGGAPGHGHVDPRGPDAAGLLARFFDRHRLDPDTLRAATPHRCREWWAAPWWHLTWGGTMSLGEYTCDMSPWRVVWRHEIEGVHGPGRCP